MKVEHLGDGAYVTFTGYSYMLTAGHHLPEEASDVVHLEPEALEALIRFKDQVEKHADTETKPIKKENSFLDNSQNNNIKEQK